MKKCNCGKCNWEWQVDSDLTSWVRCKNCNSNMFDKGIGVILINWDFTNIRDINIIEVFHSNKHNSGIVIKNEKKIQKTK